MEVCLCADKGDPVGKSSVRTPILRACLLGLSVSTGISISISPCGAAEFSVAVTTYPANGTLSSQPSHTSVSNYGFKPVVLLNGNADNSYDVAYHLNGTSKIRILAFDSSGKLSATLQPDSIYNAKGLVGMARIPDDSGFAVIYSKDSPHSGSAYEFWATRVDAKGQKLFSKLIFGDVEKHIFDSKGEPGTFSSGRMLYNKTSKKLAIYVGHTMAWAPDTVRHQAGFLAFMSLDGSFVVTNGWYSSHNFDQRLHLVGNDYYTLAHGDAYPRALGFAKWSDAGAKGSQVFDKQFLKIPGAVGDNKTSTQLGNLVPFGDGTFGVMFATANGRNAFDVGYRHLSATGDTLSLTWVTTYPAGTFAIFPKMVKYGTNVLLLWEEVAGTASAGIQLAILDPAGTVVTPKFPLADKSIRLSPYYDVTALLNGKILWANQKGNDSISILRLVESGSVIQDTRPLANALLRLDHGAEGVTLTAFQAGWYSLRQFDSRGKLLSQERRFFRAGTHALSVSAASVSYLEARYGDQKARLALIRSGAE